MAKVITFRSPQVPRSDIDLLLAFLGAYLDLAPRGTWRLMMKDETESVESTTRRLLAGFCEKVSGPPPVTVTSDEMAGVSGALSGLLLEERASAFNALVDQVAPPIGAGEARRILGQIALNFAEQAQNAWQAEQARSRSDD